MATNIGPKFHIEWNTQDGFRIVKTSNGEAIPEDEPLMLFRARDRNALEMLHFYRTLCTQDGCTDFHMAGIENRIKAFAEFRETHPERMKQPGITKGK